MDILVLEGVVGELLQQFIRRVEDESAVVGVCAPQPPALLHVRCKDGRTTQTGLVTHKPDDHVLRQDRDGELVTLHDSRGNTEAYVPFLRGCVYTRAIVVLQETETVEDVHHEPDGWEFHVNSTPRLGSIVLLKGQVHVVTQLQL